MKLPTLSVITPSLNNREYLEDAIQSVVQQQGVTVEHIVEDGASTDGTLDLLRDYPQLRWTSEPDAGQSDAINKGFLRATGDLVGWLNADDYYLPGGLEAVARAAQEHPEADVIYGDCVFVDAEGRLVRSKVEHDFDFNILLYFGCYIPSTSTFFRRRIIEAGRLLDPGYRVCMDFEFFVRLAHAGHRFLYLPHFVAAFRWHVDNTSLRQAERRVAERRQVQARFGRRRYSVPELKWLRQWSRVKRVAKKFARGNVVREFRVKRQRGLRTLWTRYPEDLRNCQRLA